MPAELRDSLLKWYFERRRPLAAEAETLEPEAEPLAAEAETLEPETERSGVTVEDEADVSDVMQGSDRADDSAEDATSRIQFAELVRVGLLKPGDQIWCRALKRQQRNGSGAIIKNAVVMTTGMVEFSRQKYSNPSKLARAMVNANGGNAKALNGYDYLFVRQDSRPISLGELRKWLLEGTPAESAWVETLWEDPIARGAFGSKREALEYVRRKGLASGLK